MGVPFTVPRLLLESVPPYASRASPMDGGPRRPHRRLGGTV